MMASNSESIKGARRRTTFIPRVEINNSESDSTSDTLNIQPGSNNVENGRDSGLSSENSTPTGGSPPPRQQKNLICPMTISNSIIVNHRKNDGSRIGNIRTSRLLRNRIGTDSPRSLDSGRTRQISNPFKPVLISNGQTPTVDSGDESSPRLERCNYHQDIVYIKTGLLKLMRIIQESEEKDLMRAETLNPFNNTMNGLFHNLNEEGTTETGSPLTNRTFNGVDELTDLRRQIIFLEGQLEDKDRAMQQLQCQVAKQQELINSMDSQSCASSMYGSSLSSTRDVSNAATQTEKIRPLSAGPSMLLGIPEGNNVGPLVSWNEVWNHQNPPSQRPSSLEESNSTINIKNNRRTSDTLHRPSVQSKQEQSTDRQNNETAEKPPINSSTIRRVVTKKSLSNSEIHKSCIPSLKKITTLSYIPRVARTDVLITRKSNNSP